MIQITGSPTSASRQLCEHLGLAPSRQIVEPAELATMASRADAASSNADDFCTMFTEQLNKVIEF